MIIKPFAVLDADEAEKLVRWFNTYHPWDRQTIDRIQEMDILDFWSDLRDAVRELHNPDL